MFSKQIRFSIKKQNLLAELNTGLLGFQEHLLVMTKLKIFKEDLFKNNFLISHPKHMLSLLIRIVSRVKGDGSFERAPNKCLN